MAPAQITRFHLDACPSHATGSQSDCTCGREVRHYRRLAQLSFRLFLFELIIGLFSGSVALVSDALHVLVDWSESRLSAFISKLARKSENEDRLRRIGGYISAALLLLAGGFIIHEGYERLLSPHEVEWYMSVAALISWGVQKRLQKLHREAPHEHHNHTHFWQWLHIVLDKWSCLMVSLGGAVMLATGAYWIDGVLSIAIGLTITALVTARFFGWAPTCSGHHH